ncbi:MAG: hypothetical protein IJD90_03820, partial [Clostridia bacterium]|nr:hypothetical protein [Clostridia bacterium]
MSVKNINKLFNDKTIIYMLFGSVFLPFVLTGIVMFIAFLYIILNKKIDGCFEKKGTVWALIFTIYCIF